MCDLSLHHTAYLLNVISSKERAIGARGVGADDGDRERRIGKIHRSELYPHRLNLSIARVAHEKKVTCVTNGIQR